MIGRFWGADAIGIYGRAYQIINIPTDNLNSAVGEVAFSALSRLKDDPVRFRSYFLKGFSLVLGLTLPVTIACALFADDMVFVLLGPKWKDAATIVRLLAPTITIFAIINPLGWLVFSLGLVGTGVEDRSRVGDNHDCGLRYGIALWTQRGRIRLLGGAYVMGYSAYFGVRARYDDFRPRHSGGGKSTTGIRHLSRRGSLWRRNNLRPISLSFASARFGKRRTCHRILRGALVCRWTEITVSRSSCWIEGPSSAP